MRKRQRKKNCKKLCSSMGFDALQLGKENIDRLFRLMIQRIKETPSYKTLIKDTNESV